MAALSPHRKETIAIRLLGQKRLQFAKEGAGATQLAFPNDKDRPAHSAQLRAVCGIPPLVAEQFRSPILKPRAGHSSSAAARMPMPEAPMDEDDLRFYGKHNVGTAWEIGSVEPVAEPATMKQASDLALGPRIFALDAPHVFASAIWRYVVHLLYEYPFGRSRMTGQRAV